MVKIGPKKSVSLLILVASLGYFVDIYDLILFNIVKKESLESLNFSPALETTFFNWQMFGMLLGGLIWGILGDKKGRVQVLFGSILLYSIANIANAFVTTVEAYSFWRLLAGIGLAGELGAAVTLVAESMKTEKRGIGTMVIVTFGALGAVAAFFVSENGEGLKVIFEKLFHTKLELWQVTYLFGGFMGLMLLILRVGTFESGMYKNMSGQNIRKGNFFQLFKNKKTTWKYLACIAIGLPVWFVIGILMNLSNKFFPEIGVASGVSTKDCILFAYMGLAVGDLWSGLLSQMLKSRKKVILLNLILIVVFTVIMFLNKNVSASYFKTLSFLLGASTGYWALFVTNASEQFGTNIRSTVAATVPNFVRGAVVLITNGFLYLSENMFKGWVSHPYILGATIVGIVCIGLSFWATLYVPESFKKELDYVEF